MNSEVVKGEFSNDYEPENSLQKAWDNTWGCCLCGHTEWCIYCDGTMSRVRDDIKAVARTLGYQLYMKPDFWRKEPCKVKMVEEKL